MASFGTESQKQQRSASKPACTLCSRRKVKCDRQEPACGNCIQHHAECRYEEPPPPQRHTKRRADSELRDRLNHLEQLLRERGIDPGTGETANSSQTPLYKAEKQSVPSDTSTVSKTQPAIRPTPVAKKHPLLPLDGASCVKFLRRRYHAASSPSMSSHSPMPSASNLLGMHPEPRHIFRLWQIFAERTNPMTKIVHAPTVQQRIFDTSWNTETWSKSFQALLFAIYLLAVVSLSNSECLQYFEADRNNLMELYGTGAWLSLLAAGVFETRDIEVLQALVLFILSDPASETATTLSAVAVRIGLKMGLDQESDPKIISLFNQEMRIRLWWQISTQDVLARHLFSSRETQDPSLLTPSVRLPLNVNDTELHPDMVKQPAEHPRASEMIYVLMKYEGAVWGQRQRLRRQPKEETPNFNFDELERLLEQKYLSHCDPRIPLHAAAQTMARSSIHIIHYMRARIKAGGTMPTDSLFDQAIGVLELDKENRELPFATQLVWHGGPIQLDAVVHVLTKLRQLVNGDRATKAWELVAKFWNEQIDGDWEGDDSFFDGLVDLTLEAWHARRKALADTYGQAMVDDMTPRCIKRLQEMRRPGEGDGSGSTGQSAADIMLDDTTNASLLSQAAFEWSTENMPQDWDTFNNDFFYNFGYWSDFSLL